MARHHRTEDMTVHHTPLDALNWPLAGLSIATWPFLGHLWDYAPTPTALYMAISAAFMLFQMCDKLGLLHRFKRKLDDAPDDPPPQKEHS